MSPGTGCGRIHGLMRLPMVFDGKRCESSDACDLRPVPCVPWKWAPLLFVFFAVLIAVLTWPWLETCSSSLIRHWDPPFHAWKLNFLAEQIASGHILPPDGNTNMYYPYGGAFYYEALHWPQGLFAALFNVVSGHNPVLTYHVTLIFFWALSGVFMWAFLRALPVSPVASAAGALVFVIMPYRMSYAQEFNMQLCFGVPLFLFFLVRFVQRPNLMYAVGMAIAFWLQAVSELYQAVFLVFVLPFSGLGIMRGRWGIAASGRRFWVPIVLSALLCLVLCLVWMMPYAELLNSRTLSRDLKEISTHVLEPLSYIAAYGHFGVVKLRNVRTDEMSVYCTLLLLFLSACMCVSEAVRRNRGGICAAEKKLRRLRAVLFLSFLILAAAAHFKSLPGLLGMFYSWLPVGVCAVSLIISVSMCRRAEEFKYAVLEGLFSAALFSFFMSLGPEIISVNSGSSVKNPLFMLLYESVDALKGFRVVSRFSLFVMIWLIAASSAAFDCIVGMRRGALRCVLLSCTAVLAVLFLAACPNRSHSSTMNAGLPVRSDVLDSLDAREDPYVLAIVPMGMRSIDSMHMLQIAGSRRLSVYAWGGTYPHYTVKVREALSPNESRGNLDRAGNLLAQLWPECFVLFDKCTQPMRVPGADLYLERMENVFLKLDEDERFVLFKPVDPQSESPEHIKMVRHDILSENPCVEFSVSSKTGGNVVFDFNGVYIGEWHVSAGEARYVRLSLPDELFVKYFPNRFRFHGKDDAVFSVDEFRLAPKSGGEDSVVEFGGRYDEWMSQAYDVPVGAYRCDTVFAGGAFHLLGLQLLEDEVAPGGHFKMRCFIARPTSLKGLSGLMLCPGIESDGMVIYEDRFAVCKYVDMQLTKTGYGGPVYFFDVDVAAPDVRLCKAGSQMNIALTMRDSSEKRISGRNASGEKVRRIFTPLRVTVVGGG